MKEIMGSEKPRTGVIQRPNAARNRIKSSLVDNVLRVWQHGNKEVFDDFEGHYLSSQISVN